MEKARLTMAVLRQQAKECGIACEACRSGVCSEGDSTHVVCTRHQTVMNRGSFCSDWNKAEDWEELECLYTL